MTASSSTHRERNSFVLDKKGTFLAEAKTDHKLHPTKDGLLYVYWKNLVRSCWTSLNQWNPFCSKQCCSIGGEQFFPGSKSPHENESVNESLSCTQYNWFKWEPWRNSAHNASSASICFDEFSNTMDSSKSLNLFKEFWKFHYGLIQVRAWICLKAKLSTLWNSPRLSFLPFSCNKDCTWNGFMWFLASINPCTHTLAVCVQTSVSTRFH